MRTLLAPPLSRPAVAAWRYPVLFTLLALASLSGGIATLVFYQQSDFRDALRVPAAAILLLTAVVQGQLAWRLWQTRANPPRPRLWPTNLTRGLFVGIVLCYLAVLSAGPGPAAPWLFAAGVMGWFTLLWLALTAQPAVLDRWRKIMQGRGSRHVARFAYLALLVAVVGEMALRAGGWLWGTAYLEEPRQPEAKSVRSSPVALNVQLVSTHGTTSLGSTSLGTPSLGTRPAASAGRRGPRVAVLGDEIALAAMASQSALVQLESALPAIEVFNLGMPQSGPREYARRGIQQAHALKPDLVLTFYLVSDDIVGEPALPDPFDWRSLCMPRIVQRWTGWPTREVSKGLPLVNLQTNLQEDNWETYVAACGPQLTVCRKPIDAAMQRRWKTTLGHFDDLMEYCRVADLRLALVIVPSPLQTSRPLLEAVCRRQGCGLTDVDVELPQRRLAAYAADRKLPLLDLLPPLRLCQEQPYVHHGCQWNNVGNEVAAHALGNWLQSTFATPLAAGRRTFLFRLRPVKLPC